MKTLRPKTLASWCALALLFSASSAHAHILSGETGGFESGFLHPWSGWDHIIAMVAVGIWGAQIGRPAIWLLPVVFPMVMAFGGFLGLLGVPMPGGEHSVEIGIALSGILLGLMVLGDVHPNRLAAWLFSRDEPATAARKGKNLGYTLAVVMVGFFGLCHGYAHGSELPPGESGLYYSIGFVIATGTLHACGISLGLIHRWPAGQVLLRLCGVGIALGGVYFMWDALHPEPTEKAAPKAAAMQPKPPGSAGPTVASLSSEEGNNIPFGGVYSVVWPPISYSSPVNMFQLFTQGQKPPVSVPRDFARPVPVTVPAPLGLTYYRPDNQEIPVFFHDGVLRAGDESWVVFPQLDGSPKLRPN